MHQDSDRDHSVVDPEDLDPRVQEAAAAVYAQWRKLGVLTDPDLIRTEADLAKYGGTWRLLPDEGYVVRTEADGSNTRLHCLIMDAPPGEVVDHINGNRRDNRRGNLDICTRAENAKNRGPDSRNATGYTGVYEHKDHVARGLPAFYFKYVDRRGKRKSHGYWRTAEEAHEARRKVMETEGSPFARGRTRAERDEARAAEDLNLRYKKGLPMVAMMVAIASSPPYRPPPDIVADYEAAARRKRRDARMSQIMEMIGYATDEERRQLTDEILRLRDEMEKDQE
jgi:hypothetical protein